jgi:hypothetical protein
MRHYDFALCICLGACAAFGQCTIYPSPGLVDLLGSTYGDPIPPANTFFILGLDSNGSGAKVKFRLDRIVPPLDGLLVVSPSSGTRPVQVSVGLNPKAVGLANPKGVSPWSLPQWISRRLVQISPE